MCMYFRLSIGIKIKLISATNCNCFDFSFPDEATRCIICKVLCFFLLLSFSVEFTHMDIIDEHYEFIALKFII